jgi:hypothetical protein
MKFSVLSFTVGRSFSEPSEELRELSCTFDLENTADHRGSMIEACIGCDLKQRLHGSRFRIGASKHDARNTSIHDRSRAHRTWLLRDVERCFHPPGAEHLGCFAKRDDLCVRRGITIDFASIATTSELAIIASDDDGADGNIARCTSRSRFFERYGHPIIVLFHFADPRGVEPLTPGSVGRCSIH